jgi:hypothetical protein
MSSIFKLLFMILFDVAFYVLYKGRYFSFIGHNWMIQIPIFACLVCFNLYIICELIEQHSKK